MRSALLAALLLAFPALAEEPKDADKDKGESKAEITVKGAKTEEAAKARLRADAAIARCQIKPVMTDEEIRVCVSAYRQSR